LIINFSNFTQNFESQLCVHYFWVKIFRDILHVNLPVTFLDTLREMYIWQECDTYQNVPLMELNIMMSLMCKMTAHRKTSRNWIGQNLARCLFRGHHRLYELDKLYTYFLCVCWCNVLRWIWCLWCYSECISTPGKLEKCALPTTFGILAQCSANWATWSGRFEHVIFWNWV
jgi:hypothetical protein